jgi:hypothetical protein
MHEIKSFKIFQTARLIAVLYAIGAAIFLAIAAFVPSLWVATLDTFRR